MFANDFFDLQNLADILLEIIVDVDFRLLLTFFFLTMWISFVTNAISPFFKISSILYIVLCHF